MCFPISKSSSHQYQSRLEHLPKDIRPEFHDSRSLGSSWCLEIAPHAFSYRETTVRLLSYLRSQGRWRVRAATEATKANQSERLLWCCNVSIFFNIALSTEMLLDFELQLPTATTLAPRFISHSFKVSFPSPKTARKILKSNLTVVSPR